MDARGTCGFRELRFVRIDGVAHQGIGCAIMSPNRSIERVQGATEPAYLIPGPHATRVP